ncbi:zinc ribbon domain-containing protein [Pseudarthrobacter sp. NPDC058196]|uniref:zinc ribbon domain-containing protein n=1 Tax=Pseudarthrobacter sp. NPDC058196 TaxID=3346376 RepID=UPI0036DD8FD4
MSYCTNCGGQLAPGARFCTSCGTPSGAAPTPAQPAAAEPASQDGSTNAQPQRGAATVPERRPASGAFASVPVSDYVRDALALFLLLISMFMAWTFGKSSTGSVAATRIDVILITLVSMFSVAIPYLWRSGVFGPAWDYRKTQLARLGVNAPYFVLVVVYLVLELVNKTGLGPAMAFGLAGAILAAQPRRAELGSTRGDAETDRRWGMALIGFGAVVGLLTVIQFIERMTVLPATEWSSTLVTVLLGAANVALLVSAALGTVRGNDVRRQIGIGIGAAGLGIGLLGLIPAVTIVTVVFQAYSPAFSVFFWLAFGAIASSPSVGRLTRRADPKDNDAALARTRAITLLAVVVLGLLAVVSALVLISFATYSGYGATPNTVPWVVVIFLAVVGAVAGVVVRAAQKQHTRQAYILSAGYAGVLFILGLVIVIMAATSYMTWNGTMGLLVAFVLPLALALSVFGTASRREAFRTATNATYPGFTFASPAQPAAYGAAPDTALQGTEDHTHGLGFGHGSDSHGNFADGHGLQGGGQAVQVDDALGSIFAESADPASPPARLYEIAAQYPQARVLIAENPAAYPALLTWLAEQQDPEIDAALARRRS